MAATEFGCNLEAVERTASQLAKVVEELRGFHDRGGEYHWALVSDKIENAVRDFSNDSSDFRDKVSGTIEALQKMLQGLAEGVRNIDDGLAKSLPEASAIKVPEGCAPK